MRIADIVAVLEEIAPPHLQESYDNAGLIVGQWQTPVSGVLFCLDSTEAIVDEAIAKGCNLVVAHHPIVFRGLKRFNHASYVERTVEKAIRAGVAIYAIHTNLDNVLHRGVNTQMAARLQLQRCAILAPKPGQTDIGSGLVGYLSAPMAEMDFLQWVKTQFHAGAVRHTALRGRPVEKVALCGGSGSFLLGEARRAGADVFVTADFKYHEFFDAEGALIIADIGHYESEQFTISLLRDIVQEKFPTFALQCTNLNTNPIQYI